MQDHRIRRPYGSGGLTTEKRANGREVWIGSWRPAPGAPLKKKVLGQVRTRGGADGLTRAEAERALREAMGAEPKTAATRRPGLTVAEAARRYLIHKQAAGRKATTLRHIESAHRLWIVPTLGDRPIAKLTDEDFDRLASAMVREGRATKYVRNVCGEFASLMRWAVRKGYATTTPADLSRLPKSRPTTRLRFLTVDEVDLLVARVPEGPRQLFWQAMFLTAAQTGLRQGELRALRWSNVDWRRSSIRVLDNVERSFDVDRTPDASAPAQGRRRTADGTTKTVSGERRVPMPDEVAGTLDRLYRSQGEPGEGTLVFASPVDGGPVGETTIQRHLAATLGAAGLARHTFHDLRHTFGTSMAAAGVPMRTLQAWMGHEDIRTTQVYAHYSPAHDEAATVTAAFAALRGPAEDAVTSAVTI